MKTRIITVCFLFLQLLFAGCSKEEAIDNVDPDVPEVEIPEEDMEIAIQNLERVDGSKDAAAFPSQREPRRLSPTFG